MEIKQVTDLVRALQRAKGDEAYPRGKAVFLVGAGCSKSAGIPLGSEIANQCVGKLAEGYSNGEVVGANSADAIAWLKENKEIPEHIKPEELYGYLFEHHYQDPVDQQRIILDAIKSCDGKINWAHLCLGELVNQRYIHTVLTTNFDQLVLEGIIRTGMLPVVADGVESLTRVSGKPHAPQVVHLHGSMHTYRPLNSVSAVKDTDQDLPFQSALYSLLHDSSMLVVIGYAGGEEGVMSLLIESAKRLPDKVIYWVQYGANPNELSKKGGELLCCGKNKFLVTGQDADAFFAELMKGLALGTPEWMKQPITSLKKHAARIAPTDNQDISGEVARYQKRLEGLENYLEQEGQLEKMLGEIRELRLAGKHLEALELLRQLETSNAPEVWEMRASSAYDAGQYSSDAGLFEESMESQRKYLSLVSRESAPEDWARGQGNLGVILASLGEREVDTTKLKQAIEAFEEALTELTQERDPQLWASQQNNLGNALAALGKRESDVDKLQQGVEAYISALQERSREHSPLEWAETQSNLGDALREWGQVEADATKLQLAVGAFEEALEEIMHEHDPLRWATIQNNLGIALAILGTQEEDNTMLERAVVAFENALKERTRERVPFDWAATQLNLSNILQTLGQVGLDIGKLERAGDTCRRALEVFREMGADYYVKSADMHLQLVLSSLERIREKSKLQ